MNHFRKSVVIGLLVFSPIAVAFASGAVNNVFLWTNALASNTTGKNNVAIGSYTLYSNTTGKYNIWVGVQSLYRNTSGNKNIAVGDKVLFNNTTGFYNVSMGNSSLYNNTTGSANTAVWVTTLKSNTTGTNNAAFGSYSLRNNTVGSFNSAIGSQALLFNESGNNNVANGKNALLRNISGSDNIALWREAGDDITTWSKNIMIGFNTNPTSATASKQLNIWNWIFGINGNIGIGTDAPTAKLSVAGTANKPGGGPWVTFSDERLKDVHGNYTKGLNEILQLQAKTFSYKRNNDLGWDSNVDYIGFIAQDVQNIFPESVKTADNGYLELDAQAIDVAVINAIQELNEKNQELEAQIIELQNQLAEWELVY